MQIIVKLFYLILFFRLQIFVKSVIEDPVLFINSPTDLEVVWHQHLGFGINSYNLKATYPESSANTIIFTITRYLEHSYLFNVKQERVVTQFSQEDINDQLIVLVLKTSFQTTDYFTFSVRINGTMHKKEYRYISISLKFTFFQSILILNIIVQIAVICYLFLVIYICTLMDLVLNIITLFC